MTKRFLSLSLLASASFCAHAQNTVLIADTAITTGVGASGSPISAIATGGTLFGNNINETLFFRVAEDFTIPTGETWRIDSLITYSYQTGSSTTSTYTSGYVRLYNGVPGSGGTLMVGDTTTNRLGSSSFTGIYRVNTSTSTDLTRPIMRLAISVPATTPVQLPAGTYWISWSAKGSLTSGPWSPPKVTSAGAFPTGQNARANDTGVWAGAVDGTTAIGYNFILKGNKTGGTSVGSEASKLAFKLNVPYPNPLSQGSTTTLSFSIGQKSHVSVRILNAVGQQVATVVEDDMTAGEYMIPFSTANLATGVYRVMLHTESGSTAVPLTVK